METAASIGDPTNAVIISLFIFCKLSLVLQNVMLFRGPNHSILSGAAKCCVIFGTQPCLSQFPLFSGNQRDCYHISLIAHILAAILGDDDDDGDYV